jgi:Protein of unknown function (DUF2997)
MKTIEIIVTPDGRTSVQTLGFSGPSCRDASRFIEEALGERIAENRTAEFYQTTDAHQAQRQRH